MKGLYLRREKKKESLGYFHAGSLFLVEIALRDNLGLRGLFTELHSMTWHIQSVPMVHVLQLGHIFLVNTNQIMMHNESDHKREIIKWKERTLSFLAKQHKSALRECRDKK